MENLYLVPLVIAIVISIYILITNQTRRKKMIDRPFINETSNDLYTLSYSIPFKWFVNPDENNSKVKDINRLIKEAGMQEKINYRVFTSIQIGILIISIIMFMMINLIIDNIAVLVKFLFNISMDTAMASPTGHLKAKLFIGMVLLICCLIPKIWLKNKAKNNNYYFHKDLPIIQLFVILMLRSKRTIGDVLYVLSRTNTRYKQIFETGYRIYLRNKAEGFQYIQKSFEDTKFEETIVVLSEYNEYSKSESLKILENIMKEITDYTNNLKRKNDLSKLIFSQGSLFIPFLSIILLGIVPIAVYGLSFFDYATKI